MIVYLDSSVLLRFVLEQPGTLDEVEAMAGRITSRLTEIECLRAVDNARLLGRIDEEEQLARRQAVYDKLRGVSRVSLAPSILARAGWGFPTPLKTLDAIHMATALQLRNGNQSDLAFATHDRQLGRVAAALDFEVIGVP